MKPLKKPTNSRFDSNRDSLNLQVSDTFKQSMKMKAFGKHKTLSTNLPFAKTLLKRGLRFQANIEFINQAYPQVAELLMDRMAKSLLNRSKLQQKLFKFNTDS